MVAGSPFGVSNPWVQVEIFVTWTGICLVKLVQDPNYGTEWKQKSNIRSMAKTIPGETKRVGQRKAKIHIAPKTQKEEKN